MRSMKTRRSAILRRDGGFKVKVESYNAGGTCITEKWHINCCYCNTLLDSPKKMSIDHVIPRSKGGSNHIDNLVICCEPCNTKKGDKFLVDFIAENGIVSM